MGQEKAALKIQIATALGEEINSLYNRELVAIQQQEGKIKGWGESRALLEALRSRLEEEVAEGVHAEETARLAKRYVERCIRTLEEQEKGAHQRLMLLRGRVSAYKDIIRIPEQMIEEESLKLSRPEKSSPRSLKEERTSCVYEDPFCVAPCTCDGEEA